MHDVVAFLKDAVTRGPGAGAGGCYVVKDGNIYARSMMMQAGVAWDAGAEFTIPADALDAALARMKEITELKIEADAVIIKSGRLKSSIKRQFVEAVPIPDFPDVWTRSPPGLSAALARAKPFIGERIWMTGVRLWDGRVTAVGKALIDIDVPGLEIDRACLLSEGVVSFLAAQGDPDEMVREENSISFRWEDGRWMRAQLIDDEMPEKHIVGILEKGGRSVPVDVTDEMREAVADMAALSDGIIELTDAGFRGMKENATVEAQIEVDVPEDHKSCWEVKSLGSVLKEARAWNPAAWPDPARWEGDDCRGALVGYRR